VAVILAGEKTTTTGLVAEYEHANDPLPVPGLREVVVDSGDRPVAIIEAVRVCGARTRTWATRWARDLPWSRNGGPVMSGSGTRPRCARLLVIPLSPSGMTPWS
jgi:ASCH domain